MLVPISLIFAILFIPCTFVLYIIEISLLSYFLSQICHVKQKGEHEHFLSPSSLAITRYTKSVNTNSIFLVKQSLNSEGGMILILKETKIQDFIVTSCVEFNI